jgi:hypothetical protein
MGGAGTSSRNVQCWDEALGLARKHHDMLLEAMTTKCMGNVAKQFGCAAQPSNMAHVPGRVLGLCLGLFV